MQSKAAIETSKECGILDDLDFLLIIPKKGSEFHDIDKSDEDDFRAFFRKELNRAFSRSKPLISDDACGQAYAVIKQATIDRDNTISGIVSAKSFKFRDLFNRNADKERAAKISELKADLASIKKKMIADITGILPAEVMNKPAAMTNGAPLKDCPEAVYHKLKYIARTATRSYLRYYDRDDDGWNIVPFIST